MTRKAVAFDLVPIEDIEDGRYDTPAFVLEYLAKGALAMTEQHVGFSDSATVEVVHKEEPAEPTPPAPETTEVDVTITEPADVGEEQDDGEAEPQKQDQQTG
jgi:hypothetical protein